MNALLHDEILLGTLGKITIDYTQLGHCNPSFGIATSISCALPFSTDAVRSQRLAILDYSSQNLSFLPSLQIPGLSNFMSEIAFKVQNSFHFLFIHIFLCLCSSCLNVRFSQPRHKRTGWDWHWKRLLSHKRSQEYLWDKWSSLEVMRRFDEPGSLILLEHGKAGMDVTTTRSQICNVYLVARHPGFIYHWEGPCIAGRTLNSWFLSILKTVSAFIICGFYLYGLIFRDSSHPQPQWL